MRAEDLRALNRALEAYKIPLLASSESPDLAAAQEQTVMPVFNALIQIGQNLNPTATAAQTAEVQIEWLRESGVDKILRESSLKDLSKGNLNDLIEDLSRIISSYENEQAKKKGQDFLTGKFLEEPEELSAEQKALIAEQNKFISALPLLKELVKIAQERIQALDLEANQKTEAVKTEKASAHLKEHKERVAGFELLGGLLIVMAGIATFFMVGSLVGLILLAAAGTGMMASGLIVNRSASTGQNVGDYIKSLFGAHQVSSEPTTSSTENSEPAAAVNDQASPKRDRSPSGSASAAPPRGAAATGPKIDLGVNPPATETGSKHRPSSQGG